MGGVQNLEWSNVKRPIFRNFKITYIRIAKDKLVDYFISEFFKIIKKKITWTLKVFKNFSKFHKFSKLLNFGNFIIFQIKKITIFFDFPIYFKK